MSIKLGPEGVDFQGKRGVLLADGLHDRDAVTLRQLRKGLATFSGITGSTSIVSIGDGYPVYVGYNGSEHEFRSFSALTPNLYMICGDTITYALNDYLIITGLTATTITTFELSASTLSAVNIDAQYYYSAGTPLDYTFREKIWCASTGTEAIIRNNYTNNIAAGNFSINAGAYSYSNGNFSIIAGGSGNTLNGNYGVIGGGVANKQYGLYSVVGAGSYNLVSGTSSFVGAGFGNRNYNNFSSILGGFGNYNKGVSSSILGGNFNTALTSYSSVFGSTNLVNASFAINTGGYKNRIYNVYGFIGNGLQNIIQSGANFSSILNGKNNLIRSGSTLSVILNGSGNTIDYNLSNTVILGGHSLSALSSNTFYSDHIVSRSLTASSTNYVFADPDGHLIIGSAPIINFTGSGVTNIVNTGLTHGVLVGIYDTVAVLKSLSAGSNLNLFSSSTENSFALKNDIAISGLTATTITAGTIDAAIYLSAGTPLNLYERLWTASTGIESVVRNNNTGNIASGNYSIIGGAFSNSSGRFSAIAGGSGNTLNGHYGFIGAGKNNFANDVYPSIIGGTNNVISGGSINSFLGNGIFNRIDANGGYNFASTILNGNKNLIFGNGQYNLILGGLYNTGNSVGHSIIIGGAYNQNYGAYSIVGSGNANIVENTIIVGSIFNGFNNKILNSNPFTYTVINPPGSSFLYYSSVHINDGIANTASTKFSTILNGKRNFNRGINNLIGQGDRNKTYFGYYNNIINGSQNYIKGATPGFPISGTIDYSDNKTYNTILNGKSNYIFSLHSTVLNGLYNKIYGKQNLIGSGNLNIIERLSSYNSIINGSNNIVKSGNTQSVILNGTNNFITSNLSNAVILGGANLSALSSNTIYVDHVVARSLTSVTPSYVLAQADGHLIIGSAPTGNSGTEYLIFNTGSTHGILWGMSGSNVFILKSLSAGSNLFLTSSSTENSFSLSPNVLITSLSANSISASTFYSASTDLSLYFSPLYWTASTGVNSLIRNNNTGNIASGIHSLVAGKTNFGSGNYSFIGNGFSGVALSTYSFVGNGLKNSATTNIFTTVINGSGNTASGAMSVVIQGKRNLASGNRSSVLNGDSNVASGLYSVILNGQQNSAITKHSLVVNGYLHAATGYYSSVVNGRDNRNYSSYSTIVNGTLNRILTTADTFSFIGGGHNNILKSVSSRNVIVGGRYNIISATTSNFIGGGFGNNIYGLSFNTVGGGSGNKILGNHSYGTIAGGRSNYISGTTTDWCAIGGGFSNKIYGSYKNHTIAGGRANKIGPNTLSSNAIGGGYGNKLYGGFSIIAAGRLNRIGTSTSTSTYVTIGGGNSNIIIGGLTIATIAGGSSNIISGTSAFIGGGINNTGATEGSIIVGGNKNFAGKYTNNIIVGGYLNKNYGGFSFVGGGRSNRIASTSLGHTYGFIGGGINNYLLSNGTAGPGAIAGGQSNTGSTHGFIGGGYKNFGSNIFSVVVGGRQNTSHRFSIVGSGSGNSISTTYNVNNRYSAILVGLSNYLFGRSSFIGAGRYNSLIGSDSFIGTGRNNNLNIGTSGVRSTILNGSGNTITSSQNTILNGIGNSISNSLYSIITNGTGNTISATNGMHHAIINGHRNFIGSANTSHITILNTEGVTANTSNSVYVPKLFILSANTGGTQFLTISTNQDYQVYYKTISAGTNVTLIDNGYALTINSAGGTGGTGSTSATYVQPGVNIYTGGTVTEPTINLDSDVEIRSLSVSGNTILSSTTAMTATILGLSGGGTQMVVTDNTGTLSVQAIPGGNTIVNAVNTGTTHGIYAGLSGNTVLIFKSLSGGSNIIISSSTTENAIALSNDLLVNSISGVSISASTLYSGSTELSNLFENKSVSKIKTNQQIHSGTSTISITELTFDIVTGKRYIMDTELIISGATGGGRFGLSGSTAPNINATFFGTTSSISAFQGHVLQTNGLINSQTVATSSALHFQKIRSFIDCTGSTGTISIVFRAVSSGNNICIQPGSFGEIREI